MALGPLLQIRKIVEHRSSQTVSVGYFLVLFVGFLLWLAYGLALIVPNAVALVVIVVTIAIVLRYRRPAHSE